MDEEVASDQSLKNHVAGWHFGGGADGGDCQSGAVVRWAGAAV